MLPSILHRNTRVEGATTAHKFLFRIILGPEVWCPTTQQWKVRQSKAHVNNGTSIDELVSVSRLLNTVQISEHLFDLTLSPFHPFPPCDLFWLSGGLTSGGGSNFIFPICLRFTSHRTTFLFSHVIQAVRIASTFPSFTHDLRSGAIQLSKNTNRGLHLETDHFLSWFVNDWWLRANPALRHSRYLMDAQQERETAWLIMISMLVWRCFSGKKNASVFSRVWRVYRVACKMHTYFLVPCPTQSKHCIFVKHWRCKVLAGSHLRTSRTCKSIGGVKF